jgi:glycosyltransferase involved in cell wall biosynthesis
MKFRPNNVIQFLTRIGFYSVVYLAESLVTLIPSVADKIYKTMRSIYNLLPIKMERKRHWADKVVGSSVLLRNVAIELECKKLVDDLAAIDSEGNTPADNLNAIDKLANDQARIPITTPGFKERLGRRALVIEHCLPMPDRTSASVRLAAIIKLIRLEGWDITFVSDNKKEKYHWILENVERDLPQYENTLRAIGVSCFYGFDQAVEILKEEGESFDLVILSYPEIMHKYAPLVRAFAPLAHLAYDTVDLHSIRFSREAAIKDNKPELVTKAEYYDRIERAGCQVADTVIAITPKEADQIVLRSTKVKELVIIPNLHHVGAQVATSEKRAGLLFVGHYLHTPNEDAVCHFVRDIYPLIEKQLPGIEFAMVGSSMTDKVEALRTEMIHAVGHVEDLEPYFAKAKVFVAPLRYGAGMKGKIGQALSFGLPVVTTSIGAEGMDLVNERQLLIADDPEAFATAAVRLYTDNVLWERLSAAGRDHVFNNFSEFAAQSTIAGLLKRAAVRSNITAEV